MKVVRPRRLIAALVVLAATAGLVAFVSWKVRPSKAIVTSNDWEGSYQNDLGHHFDLPPDVRVIEAGFEDGGLSLAHHCWATFMLDSSKTPEETLRAIALASGFNEANRVNDLHWEQEGVWRKVEFDKSKSVYRVEYIFD